MYEQSKRAFGDVVPCKNITLLWRWQHLWQTNMCFVQCRFYDDIFKIIPVKRTRVSNVLSTETRSYKKRLAFSRIFNRQSSYRPIDKNKLQIACVIVNSLPRFDPVLNAFVKFFLTSTSDFMLFYLRYSWSEYVDKSLEHVLQKLVSEKKVNTVTFPKTFRKTNFWKKK